MSIFEICSFLGLAGCYESRGGNRAGRAGPGQNWPDFLGPRF